jgi:serine/threonine-protein kinase
MTKTSAVMGSPLYMSPEQMTSSRDVDVRSDIWALGAILYELLTGRPPFIADSLPQVCAMILQSDPESMRAIRADLPEGLERIVLKCLQKKREARFPNVAELAIALMEFAPKQARVSVERITRVLTASGLSLSGFAIAPASLNPPVPVGGQTAGAWTQTASGKKSSHAGLIVAGVIAVLLVGAGSALLAVRMLHGGPEKQAVVASSLPSSVVAVPAPETAALPTTSTVVPAPSQSVAVASTTAPVPTVPPSKTSTVKGVGSAPPKKPPTKTPDKGLDLFNDNK